MTFTQFRDKYNGQPVDFDGIYPNQCMDLMHEYVYEVLGIKDAKVLAAPAAYQAYTDNYPQYFEKIDNTPDNVPQNGDIMFWGTGIGPYGHVAVFVDGDTNSFNSFDANWPTGSLCHIQHHSYNGVLGWLRPKTKEPTLPPLQGLAIDVGYNPTFEGQDVMVNGLHYKSIKDKDGNLVWKIETEVHSDPVVIEVPVTSGTGTVETSTTSTGTSTPTTTMLTQPPKEQTPIVPPKKAVSMPVSLRVFLWLLNYIKKYAR